MADDLDTTAVRRALVLDRQDEHAESIYRTTAQLRHLLPADARKPWLPCSSGRARDFANKWRSTRRRSWKPCARLIHTPATYC
jgi:hypothetical protein